MEDIFPGPPVERNGVMIYTLKCAPPKVSTRDTQKSPLTTQDACRFARLSGNFVVLSPDGDWLIWNLSQQLSASLVADLFDSIMAIDATCKPKIRGEKSLHIGHWRRYALLIYLSLDTRAGAHIFSELPGVQQFFDAVASAFRMIDPKLCEEYKLVTPDSSRVCGSTFLMCVVNKGGTGPHVDWNDRKDGCCCVAPVGTGWTGGELAFRDLKIVVDCRPGDLVYFRSAALYHENLPHTGDRRSLVMTTDHNSFTASGQQFDPEVLAWIEQEEQLAAAVKYEALVKQEMTAQQGEWCNSLQIKPEPRAWTVCDWSPDQLRAELQARLRARIIHRRERLKQRRVISASKPHFDGRVYKARNRTQNK